jgi:dihydrodiol dehydrogenase / D-xylose 1-dehydrogenase (NADP)
MAESVRWGILGPGRIARAFTADLAFVRDAAAVAVGARRGEAADAFADEFGIPRRHASYEALLDDPEVDVIYVALPHPWHAEWATRALEAGKAVLCEKPLTVNAAEARQLVASARRTGRFLMEAMWTRFVPCMVRARELVAGGAIGDVRFVAADLGRKVPADPQSRFLSPALAGGSLLDIGLYPVSVACFFLGRPTGVHATGTIGETGVDVAAHALLDFEGGRHAAISGSLDVDTPSGAAVAGTEGRIEFDGYLVNPQGARVFRGRDLVETLPVVPHAAGYRYEAVEVGRCLRDGLLESPSMPLDESIAIMETLDEIRRQVGVRYPFER